MIVGVTGTREGLTPRQMLTAIRTLRCWSGELHYGCCVGADDELSGIAWALGGYRLIAHPPTDGRWRPVAPLVIPDASVPAEPYLVRDKAIVSVSEVLIACPRQSPEKEPPPGARGEGTWWTLRHARDQQVSVYLIWPNGVLEVRGEEV